MLVGSTHYITHLYNEDAFKILLEYHLDKRKGVDIISSDLVEQCISAFLTCKEKKPELPELKKMEKYLKDNEITFIDYRKFAHDELVKGDPVDAVKAFIELNEVT